MNTKKSIKEQIVNHVAVFQAERSSVKQRLSELKTELLEAESALQKAQADFDESLALGTGNQDTLSNFQRATIQRDGLQRVVADIESRVIPAFREKEADVREQAKLVAYHTIEPVHKKTEAEINLLIKKIFAVISDYDAFRAEVSEQAGYFMNSPIREALGVFDCGEKFDYKTKALFDRLKYDANPNEHYTPSPNYQPAIGGSFSQAKDSRCVTGLPLGTMNG